MQVISTEGPCEITINEPSEASGEWMQECVIYEKGLGKVRLDTEKAFSENEWLYFPCTIDQVAHEISDPVHLALWLDRKHNRHEASCWKWRPSSLSFIRTVTSGARLFKPYELEVVTNAYAAFHFYQEIQTVGAGGSPKKINPKSSFQWNRRAWRLRDFCSYLGVTYPRETPHDGTWSYVANEGPGGAFVRPVKIEDGIVPPRTIIVHQE